MIVDRIAALVIAFAFIAWLRDVSMQLSVVNERIHSRDTCAEDVRREHNDRAARAERERDELRAKLRALEEEAAKP